jgi:hypothetical protein
MQLANRVQIDAIYRDAKPSAMDALTDQPGAEARHIHELAEAHTAIGFYLGAISYLLEGNPGLLDGRLRQMVDACIGQSERADEALRRLRRLLLDRPRGDRLIGG